jgi:hypothetical protein
MTGWVRFLENQKACGLAGEASARAEAWLERAIAKREALEPSKVGSFGATLEAMLSGLLEHPLASTLKRKPRMYFYSGLDAAFATFDDVIIVPHMKMDLGPWHIPTFHGSVRGALAHELGHVINGDFHRIARNPQLGMTHEMELNADLLAAHLCGDGGHGLADSLEQRLLEEECVARTPFGKELAMRRHEHPHFARYPALEDRIARLRQWTQGLAEGEALPGPSLSQSLEEPCDARKR